MNVAIAPSVAKGSVLAPPSKSMAHRALIAAALSEGESVLSPVALSEDMIATMESLSALGASFSRKGETVFVKGVSYPRPTGENLFCRESGSTLRFLIPLCLLTGERITLTGAPRLLERPLSVYEDLCREKGFLFEKTEESLTVCGRLCAGMYRVPGNISSQFITGLLFALSVLSEDSVLAIEGDLESASYLDMTSLAMSRFGKTVKREGKTFYLSGKSAYIPQKFTVEGDYSNAAFLEAFSLLGGEVCVSGLEKNSVQGDRVYRDFYPRLAKGCPTLDLSDCPDLAPVLFALAALFHGGVFTGTSRLAMKESDRGKAMAQELEKCGCRLILEENRIVVPKTKLFAPQKEIESHNDHRIVMAMSLVLSRVGGVIKGAQAVKKSYPDYFEQIKKLGIEVKQYETE